ncbi:uncharacterized protein K02A2.6-like [Bolinopsis microptera]|uniref:uncharacterized protein K02A2.6-like n=1 Tax=Bolinopsis microptera TaxID=2820187 RepID=UPI003079D3D9
MDYFMHENPFDEDLIYGLAIKTTPLSHLLRQSRVFEPGKFREVVGYEAQLQLKEDFKPVFRKARTVPYALKERIEETIDKMVADKILTPVDHSQIASPIVPVLKPDSAVRICGVL